MANTTSPNISNPVQPNPSQQPAQPTIEPNTQVDQNGNPLSPEELRRREEEARRQGGTSQPLRPGQTNG